MVTGELNVRYISGVIKRDRLKQNKDLVVAVCGDEGDGKSTLAMEVAKETDKRFDLERNVLYSPNFKEMENKIKGLPPYSVIVVDEAIKALYKLNWQTKLAKYTNVLYAVCRKYNQLSIMCMPRFIDFNEYFRRHRIKFWIQVIDPLSLKKTDGTAVVFAKSKNFFSDDPWYLRESQKRVEAYSKSKRMREVEYSSYDWMKVASKSRNYVGALPFHHMDDVMFAHYTELSKKYSSDDIDTLEDKPSARMVMYRDRQKRLLRMLQEQGISQEAIGKRLGVNQRRISKMLAR